MIVERQCQNRGNTHEHLDDRKARENVSEVVDVLANPQSAECKSQNERGQHELEGIGRRTDHQRKHSDPRNLVDERGKPGQRGDQEHQARDVRRVCRAAGFRAGVNRPCSSSLVARVGGNGHDDVQQPRCKQRTRQAYGGYQNKC